MGDTRIRFERLSTAPTWMRAAAVFVLVTLAALVVGAGCAAPVLTRDGQLVFTEAGGRHGASVMTANGIEFFDRADVPRPVVRRSVNEPWRPATGFLLPASGVWTKTATPARVPGRRLAVVLRSSDVLIPSWGGEILLRLDALAPAAAFPEAAHSVRPVEKLAILIDGAGPETAALINAALEDLGGTDQVGIIDTGAPQGRPRPVLPLVPGSYRTLLQAAVERIVTQSARTPANAARSRRDLVGALSLARGWVSAGSAGDAGRYVRHILVITDAVDLARHSASLAQEVQSLAEAGIRLTAVGASRLGAEALAPLGADVHPGARLKSARQPLTPRSDLRAMSCSRTLRYPFLPSPPRRASSRPRAARARSLSIQII